MTATDAVDLLSCALPSFIAGIAAGWLTAFVRSQRRPRQ